MKKICLPVLLLAAALCARAQVSQWVAYNDHYIGPNTGPNVTGWNIFTNQAGAPGNSGFLNNVMTGAQLPVVMTITNVTNGISQSGTTSSGPYPGTPAALMFTNYIDWGSGGTPFHAIQLAGASKTTHTFSGLDPTRRYSWHGSAVRGNNYSTRWTLVEISAASWEDAHTLMATGVFTTAQIPSLTSSQAVFNSGENRAPGVLVGWTNIAPNADGTIRIYQTTYRGAFPAGSGFTFDTGNYGYAIVADRLEEFIVGPITGVGITNQPQSITVPERGRATFSLMATGSPQNFQWYRSDDNGANYNAIPGATASSYSIASVAYPGDNGARFRATVSNSINAVTSSAATLTVAPDNTPPTVVRAVGLLALDTVIISFSEPMDPAGFDPGAFFLYEAGFQGDPSGTPYNTFSVTLTNQTNVIMQTTPRDPAKNYFVEVGYALDNSFNHNVLSPLPSEVPVRSQVTLIGLDTDNVWKYFVSTNVDLWATAPNWFTAGYDDSAWLSGPAPLGNDASVGAPQPAIRTTIDFSGAQPAANRFSEPTFFRRHFTFPASPSGALLSVRHCFEDGGVVWINGQLVYSNNAPAGPYVFGSRAPAGSPDPAPIIGPFNVPVTSLVSGDNLIAALVLQNGTSSDIVFTLELDAEVDTLISANAPVLRVSRGPSPGQLTISWTNGGTLQQATTLLNGGATVWTDVPGNPNPYTFTPPTSGNVFYRVR